MLKHSLLWLTIVCLSGSADGQSPHWVWHRDSSTEVSLVLRSPDACRLERPFQTEQPLQSAALRLAADFCDARVEINGQIVARVEAYSPTIDVDVTAAVKRGENRLAVIAQSVGGPAAVALSLALTAADGSQRHIVSDSSWLVVQPAAQEQTAVSLGQVAAGLWGLGRRPATIDPFDNYEQWRQAIGTGAIGNQNAFWTAPGFEIALVRAAQEGEGSWVSMAFDPPGRLTIAREDQGLLRMTLDKGRTAVERVETINSNLQECRGLLYAHNALYASANNSKGLYRLRDLDHDNQFDEVRLLREFPGGGGHGRNDLALGPDGSIYAIHGDAVDVPKDELTDYTSPFREARRGKNTREGQLLRTDSDGQQWELLAAGLRNPFGIAINARGDRFTYDADAEFDMGSPWYRPTRVLHLANGTDFGWRGVTGKWPPYFPDHADNALPTLDIGRGSPTAVTFGHGTNFPADYRQSLFILDWAYGRILAVHLAPRGAGYRAWAETFLKGRPLNVTDITVGPDGALYIVTGGRKTQSALYRIAYVGPADEPSPLSAHESAAEMHADLARQLRLELESRHRPGGPATVNIAWPHLDSPDPTIRHAARIAIEHQPPELWRGRALGERRPTAALTALLALARAGDKNDLPSVVGRLAQLNVSQLTLSQTFALLHGYFLCLEHAPSEVTMHQPAILAQLAGLFPHPDAAGARVCRTGTSAQLNRDLARLLALIEAPALVERVASSLLKSAAQEDRLQGLFVLRNVRSGWTSETRRSFFQALNEGAAFVGGEGMPKFVAQIREQAIATLTDHEREQLADLLAPRAADDEPLPPSRPLVDHWQLDDFAAQLTTPTPTADPARGAIVFRDALCARCHRAGARGPAVGPDLTSVTSRFSQQDLLDSILSPAKVVAENYRNVQITTADGRQIVGRVVVEGDFRSEKMRIATDPLRPSTIVEISKRDIEQHREAATSPMPAGLLDSFTQQEILDLLAFLASGGTDR